MSSCAAAFRTGRYESGSELIGSDEYGSLESTLASILLDSEATSSSASMEPSHGALREPILQVLNLLRSMEYQTAIPDTLDGPPMENNYHLRLWQIDEKVSIYHRSDSSLVFSTLYDSHNAALDLILLLDALDRTR